MILLKMLLAEIALDTVQPYATRSTWRQKMDPTQHYEAVMSCEGIDVVCTMAPVRMRDHAEYMFGFSVPGADGSYTLNARRGPRGKLSFLRLMRTMAEAIMDFIQTHDVDVIDMGGYDELRDKGQQKDQIYQGLLASNASRLAAIGWRAMPGRAVIVKTATADASGIEDTP